MHLPHHFLSWMTPNSKILRSHWVILYIIVKWRIKSFCWITNCMNLVRLDHFRIATVFLLYTIIPSLDTCGFPTTHLKVVSHLSIYGHHFYFPYLIIYVTVCRRCGPTTFTLHLFVMGQLFLEALKYFLGIFHLDGVNEFKSGSLILFWRWYISPKYRFISSYVKDGLHNSSWRG